ncbi:exonuclease 1 [Lathyrus oleraceus]|uniref:Exonuclease 1 n=1 Tax=Pisum sativum TaxID=3888 RepID=A0A9D4VJ08_PEA|nr:exonuclease 1 [Pisum sativum]KAI5384824.1 Rad2 nuclease [Pisum sativum]
MGIHGLLPLLKSIMLPIHIKDLHGCSVAIDTYSWLHKGALSCSTDLCKGIPTSRHIEYCMHRVNLLRHYGVKPILVFDGGFLPMKLEQENKRARVRKDNFERAVEHDSNGNSTAAYECYQKAVDISPVIARELIQVLKQENVQYIVAPYEADAQMTFLAISKQVDAVITEDSDLIPFGCPRIIFKMDKFGQGVQFQYSTLQKNKELSFEGFNRQMLLEMCILSGCDYLPSLPGMGLKKAHASIKKFKSYDKVLKHLRYSGISVPPIYEESFRKAILTFQHQRVYDPTSENIVHLSDIPEDIGDELDFLGPPLPKDIAQGIAEGDLDPITKMPFEGDKFVARLEIAGTSQFKTLNSERVKKKIDLPVQKNLLTKYFCFASLEAKREFKAPRTSPATANQSTLISSSVKSLEHQTLEAAASETMNSGASSVDSENLGSGSSPDCYIENSFSSKTSDLIESPYHVSMAGEKKGSPDHTILRQPRQPIHKPCLGLHKEHELMNVQDKVERKTKEVKRKVVVRSPYFQQKQVEKNACDEKQEQLSSGIFVDERKNGISGGDLCSSHLKNKDLKRKASPNDNTQNENLQARQMHPTSSTYDNGCSDHNVDVPFKEDCAEEENFGTNISHLGHYSEIAEKSLERFASVISAFKYTPGSRVSGLRAPLKDVRNTRNNNRPTAAEFNKYAYVPKLSKTRRVAPDICKTRNTRPAAADLSQFAYVPKQRLEE